MSGRDVNGALLSLDPSSTRTGWAAWRDGSLVDAGWLLPRRRADGLLDRIAEMISALGCVFDEQGVGEVAIEVPSGKAGRGYRAGATGHLALYGLAVGAIVATAWRAVGRRGVHAYTEREWTRSRPRHVRVATIEATYPRFAEAIRADKGCDLADAIGVGEHHLTMRRLA